MLLKPPSPTIKLVVKIKFIIPARELFQFCNASSLRRIIGSNDMLHFIQFDCSTFVVIRFGMEYCCNIIRNASKEYFIVAMDFRSPSKKTVYHPFRS